MHIAASSEHENRSNSVYAKSHSAKGKYYKSVTRGNANSLREKNRRIRLHKTGIMLSAIGFANWRKPSLSEAPTRKPGRDRFGKKWRRRELASMPLLPTKRGRRKEKKRGEGRKEREWEEERGRKRKWERKKGRESERKKQRQKGRKKGRKKESKQQRKKEKDRARKRGKERKKASKQARKKKKLS